MRDKERLGAQGKGWPGQGKGCGDRRRGGWPGERLGRRGPAGGLHFGLVLEVGHITIPFCLLLEVLFFLFGLQFRMLVEFAGHRPTEGQLCPAGQLSQLFGTEGGGAGLIGLVEAVVVDFIEPVLQRQDRGEPVPPQDLAGDVGAPSLACHPCRGKSGGFSVSVGSLSPGALGELGGAAACGCSDCDLHRVSQRWRCCPYCRHTLACT